MYAGGGVLERQLASDFVGELEDMLEHLSRRMILFDRMMLS